MFYSISRKPTLRIAKIEGIAYIRLQLVFGQTQPRHNVYSCQKKVTFTVFSIWSSFFGHLFSVILTSLWYSDDFCNLILTYCNKIFLGINFQQIQTPRVQHVWLSVCRPETVKRSHAWTFRKTSVFVRLLWILVKKVKA